MVFLSLHLDEDIGEVKAKAQGHADEVISAFHSLASLILSSRGAWRITHVYGEIYDTTPLDSDMEWILVAKLKG
jgi:hypothetical protein